ncbi:MAG: M67 family metallopeptidase [Nitrospirae bacterium]|nr:M67 family metallopeptidase [Nitrospirota bacterium]
MRLNKDTKEKIYNHALQEYPDECCGIVTGDSDKQRVHLCENIQNKLHTEDPERYQRDARTAYFIERRRFDDILSYAKENGEEIIAFYHSHPEHEAYFSEEDFAAQTVFGEPEFPDALHAVVSVMDGKIHAMKCYKWDCSAQVFTAVENCL